MDKLSSHIYKNSADLLKQAGTMLLLRIKVGQNAVNGMQLHHCPLPQRLATTGFTGIYIY